jgi:short-subunit dehydrogenase
VLPISTSTPFFENAEGNKYEPKGVVQTTEQVAKSIVRCACSPRPKAEILPYPLVRLAFMIDALFPGLIDKLLGKDHN